MNRLARTLGLRTPQAPVADADKAATYRQAIADFKAAEEALLDAEHGAHSAWVMAAEAVDAARTRLYALLRDA